MNVTPLIDVLLVLLIIFMLVVIQRSKRLRGPDSAGTESQGPFHPAAETTIIIQVRDRKSADHPDVKINNETVAWNDLRQRLVDIFAIRVERIAFVKADDDIDFERVADVIDTAHNAGVDRLGLLHDEAAAVHHRDH